MKGVCGQLKYWCLIILVILIDQWSKHWILTHFIPYEPYQLLSFLNITLVFNSGVAFGLLSGPVLWHLWIFVLLAFGVVTYLSVWLAHLKADERWLGFAISLIIAGALGNVIDRLRFGQVVDFIDVYYQTYHWPVFNIADSAICIGAFLLIFVWRKH